MGILHAAYGDYNLSFIRVLFFIFIAYWSNNNNLRSRSIHISIHRNTIRSTTPLVFPLSRLFRNRHKQRHLPNLCLQTQTPRWYVVHLIYHSSSIIYFTIKTPLLIYDLFKRFFPVCLSQAGEIIPEKDLTGNSENSAGSKEILTNPAVHLLALFILFYVGVESTIGGTVPAVRVAFKFFHKCIM